MFSINRSSIVLSAFLSASAFNLQAELVTEISGFFSPDGRVVTQDSYPTDETSRQMLKVQSSAGVNQFQHKRELTPTGNQPG